LKIAEIMSLTGASKPSIYRWMEKHPKLDQEHDSSLMGHSFPKPMRKEGREVIWDESAVHAWWDANAATVRRHSHEKPTTTIPWAKFREAMLQEPERDFDPASGEEKVIDDMELVQRFEREGAEVRVWFRNVSDAVFFKLRHG
jgi:predicted DNA-binding transcriptional regulator AlpA